MSIQKERKLNRLKQLMAIVDNGVDKESFINAFKKVIANTQRIEIKLIEDINKAIKDLKDENNTLSEAAQADLSHLSAKLEQSITKLEKESKQTMEFIYDKVKRIKVGSDGSDGYTPIKGKDYFDGKDVDKNEVIEEILNKIKLPELDTKILDKFKEDIKELKSRPSRLGGGGFSKIHMEQKFIDKETPSGTINSSNVTFTLAKAPNPTASLNLFLDGQLMTETEDFTISGVTITFLSAPLTNSVLRANYRK
jgi:hypothetical protein